MSEPKLMDSILNRINSRSMAMAVAVFLISDGLFMLMRKIEGTGSIDMKTSFLEGKLESGSVGVLFMFCGFVLVLACLVLRRRSTITIKQGDFEFTYRGYLTMERLRPLKLLIDDTMKNHVDIQVKGKGTSS